MKIAILMSTYNGEKYINKQLESLFNQKVDGHMTIYIRDDGSSDSTIEIIKRWKEKLDIVLYEESNVGPAKSFWKLFMKEDIQADYYAFCDQDDVWDSSKVQTGIFALQNEDSEALWCSNCRIIDQRGTVISEKMNKESPNFSIISQMVCGTTQGCTMLFNDQLRRYIIEKNVKIIPMHDFVIMTYAIAKGNVLYDNYPYLGYRVHSNNVIACDGKNIVKHIRNSLNIWFSSSHRNELSNFAVVFLRDNSDYLDMETQKYINNLVKSKHNIMARLELVLDKKTVSQNKKAQRSFKIRTILGII
ncbi:glycosyltransferase [Enterocloster bolteae]|uniref:glycosyltransferase n=1 Tax=Enterocloster bolteae TaxID=208479 RepID=UPI00210C7F84|nr:glycosyltransferase [Enterocloster bolteae]MCQ5146277.1 glycosyltransferase [Enterocloster bolteae]